MTEKILSVIIVVAPGRKEDVHTPEQLAHDSDYLELRHAADRGETPTVLRALLADMMLFRPDDQSFQAQAEELITCVEQEGDEAAATKRARWETYLEFSPLQAPVPRYL